MAKDIVEIFQNNSDPFHIPILKVYCKDINQHMERSQATPQESTNSATGTFCSAML